MIGRARESPATLRSINSHDLAPGVIPNQESRRIPWTNQLAVNSRNRSVNHAAPYSLFRFRIVVFLSNDGQLCQD